MFAPVSHSAGPGPEDPMYGVLLRHALVRLVLLYFVPLLLLTLFLQLQYRLLFREIEQRHHDSLAEQQAALLDMFLGDRLLNLSGLTGQADLLLAPDAERLNLALAELQAASRAFVDLAVLDSTGAILEYAGPLRQLRDRNYRQESWFRRLLAGDSSHVITDVYAGFRDHPHFTMALKMEPHGQIRILRAVLSPEEARAQVAAIRTATPPRSLLPSTMVTNIWLVAGTFCLIGGPVIGLQARWVARQQFRARQTERALSRQLAQAAKLASVGELASGVAHEINNPLAVIAEKAGLMQDLLDPRFRRDLTREEIGQHLAVIEAAVYRCTEITRQLLGFVRHCEVQLVTCAIHDLIDELLDRLLGPELVVADIALVRRYDRQLGPVLTDPGQLQQVLLNLLNNAFDAMPEPGTLTITTEGHGDRFEIRIRDTGCGIDSEQLEKVFMPFFTTKESGEGTGLGLSVSYGIIKGLGGRLSVESEPGRGTEFTIELPGRSGL